MRRASGKYWKDGKWYFVTGRFHTWGLEIESNSSIMASRTIAIIEDTEEHFGQIRLCAAESVIFEL